MSDSGPDPELVVDQIDLCFRALDDMERFLDERRLPVQSGSPLVRGELSAFRAEVMRGIQD